ncbi:5'-methylthioadenosine/S-adenosylhomocysteine nucleosidase [Cellulomonas composti]|uniref:adenosylhomocysteine nucleosidase n=1 Tax=Cellulomonas composti TaxID=266130 RepID=A0A511J9W5_9CELL|nr:5'-methylthioadenosine/S-adenosylhomocysteine nucleosidase [Cellulomonas composti]GEL94786.1 5'-methylthioadenosine/S-adenosylhomocysteine nucleosidase [Cellulomonas composti]
MSGRYAAPDEPLDAIVVVAMPAEEAPFLARAVETKEVALRGGAGAHLLRLPAARVLLVRAGIGLVNAASAASVALARFPPAALISAGSAGGLGVGVRVGDVVVGTDHVLAGADATAFGYERGQVPGMPVRYRADETLRQAAMAAAAGLAWPAQPPVRAVTGAVASADVFVDDALVDALRATFPDASAADMESAALAQVAHLFGVPFASVRAISDLCSPVEAGEFATHVDDAADRSAAVVDAMLTAIRATSA